MSPLTEDKNPVAAAAFNPLLDVELPVTVRFGRTQMTLAEIVNLNLGSLVEFDRAIDEPVEVLVNGHVIARGEAVTVRGNYGVRILEVAGGGERLKATGAAVVDAAAEKPAVEKTGVEQ